MNSTQQITHLSQLLAEFWGKVWHRHDMACLTQLRQLCIVIIIYTVHVLQPLLLLLLLAPGVLLALVTRGAPAFAFDGAKASGSCCPYAAVAAAASCWNLEGAMACIWHYVRLTYATQHNLPT